MKNLITLLIVLTSILGYTQELQWLNIDSVTTRNDRWFLENKELVELEFVRLIDSARQSNVVEGIYKEKYYVDSDPYITVLDCDRDGTYPSNKVIKEQYKIEKNNPDNDNVKLIKDDGFYGLHLTKSRKVNRIVYDSLLSQASKHHTKFLIEIEGSGVKSHREYKKYGSYTYNGDMELLEKPEDRINRYSPSRYFKGECCAFTSSSFNNVTTGKFLYQKSYKEVAYEYLERFKNSPRHWGILNQKGDVGFMGLYVDKNLKTNYIVLTVLMGS